MPDTNSLLGPAIAVEGLLLYMGTGSSPETQAVIANATDLTLPVIAETVDVTNVGNAWRARFPTLHDMGKISFKIFWVMEEPTHRNSGGSGGSVADGLRYCLINNVLAYFSFEYPDGNGSTDSFPAYVTSFSITAKVGGVFEGTIELSNSGAPTLV